MLPIKYDPDLICGNAPSVFQVFEIIQCLLKSLKSDYIALEEIYLGDISGSKTGVDF